MAISDSLRILITAGPTREYLDPVRYLSNDSSGKTGFLLAQVAAQRGHRVTLVHGPVTLQAPPGVRTRAVTSAQEMLDACADVWPRHDVLLMTAAVADYRPARASRTKIKKRAAALSLKLAPNPDVLATLSSRRTARQVVIGFALEDRAGRRNAAKKLKNKGLDAIVLNAPAAIGADINTVEVLTADGRWQRWPTMDKPRLARRLIVFAETLAQRP